MEVLQWWEGTVLAVDFSTKEFVALLRDVTRPANPEEEVTLPFSEVSRMDRELLVEGGLFHWAIGYETSDMGQTSRFSRVRFRRLPWLSPRQLAAARDRGERLLAELRKAEPQ